MTFAELEIGSHYYDSPGYHLKMKIGADSYQLVNHVDKLVMVEPNRHRPIREVIDPKLAWPPTIKLGKVHWSED